MNNLRYLTTVALLIASLWAVSRPADARGYSPVVSPSSTGVNVAVRANADGHAVLSSVANNVQVTSSVIANIARGVSVEAVVTGAVSGAAVAGAWGAALGVIGAVAIGAIPAILAWQDRAGVKVNPDGSFTANDSSVCTVAPCPFFYGRNQHGATVLTGSAAATCSLMVADYQNGGFTLQSPRASAGSCVADLIDGSGGNRGVYTVGVIYEGSGAPIPSPYVAVSKAQAVDKMSAASPTASEVQALVDLNFPPEVAPLSITGPSFVQGGNTVKLGLDGSQSTESCKFYLDYFPSNIKAHPECTTVSVTPPTTTTKDVVTTNPDGSSSSQTISTTVPGSTSTAVTTKDKVDDPSAQDTPLGDVPTLYKAKYPLGLEGVWAQQKAGLTSAPLTNLVGSLMPSVAVGGTCPVMMLDFNLASWANYGSHDVAPPCYIWDIGAIIIVMSALLLARSLVFGG